MPRNPTKLLAILSILFTLLLAAATATAAEPGAARRFVPRDAFGVSGVDVQGVKKSAVYKKLLGKLLREGDVGKELARLESETGFQLERDLRSVMTVHTLENLDDDDAILLIADARVDEARLVAFLNKGSKLERVGANGGYHRTKKTGRAIAFRDGLVLAGPEPILLRALAKSGPSAALAKQLDIVEQRDVFFAMAATPAVQRKLAKHQPELGDFETMALGADVHKGIDATAVARLRNEEAARRVAMRASELRSLLVQTPGLGQVGLEHLLDGLSVRRNERDLTMHYTLSAAQLDALIAMMQAMI